MISLVFPPSVSSGLGAYYPASAVLAGYLRKNGFGCRQIDLNFEFVRYVCANLPDLAAEMSPADRDVLAADLQFLTKYQVELARRIDVGTMNWRTSPLVPSLRRVLRTMEGGPPPINLYRRFLASDLPRGSDERWFSSSDSLVGITVAMGPQLAPARELCRALRAAGFGNKLAVGGPVITLLGDQDLHQFLVESGADIAVQFEGEEPLLQMTEQLHAGRWEPLEISNASVIKDGNLVSAGSKRGVLIKDVPVPEYQQNIIISQGVQSLSVLQARGCYWGECAYCDYINLYGDGVRYQSVTPERLVEDIRTLSHRHNISEFTLITEAIPPAVARRFSELLVAKGLGCRWTSFAMVHQKFSRDILFKMVASGCVGLVIGLESLSDNALENMKKYARRTDNIQFVADAVSAGLLLRVNLIPDLPGTSYEEAMSAADIYEEWATTGRVSFAAFEFEATKSSEVGRDPAAFGLVEWPEDIADSCGGQAFFAQNRVFVEDPAMTLVERSVVRQRYEQLVSLSDREPIHVSAEDVDKIYWVDTNGSTFVFSPRHGCLQERPITWGLYARIMEVQPSRDDDFDGDPAAWLYGQIRSDLMTIGAI